MEYGELDSLLILLLGLFGIPDFGHWGRTRFADALHHVLANAVVLTGLGFALFSAGLGLRKGCGCGCCRAWGLLGIRVLLGLFVLGGDCIDFARAGSFVGKGVSFGLFGQFLQFGFPDLCGLCCQLLPLPPLFRVAVYKFVDELGGFGLHVLKHSEDFLIYLGHVLVGVDDRESGVGNGVDRGHRALAHQLFKLSQLYGQYSFTLAYGLHRTVQFEENQPHLPLVCVLGDFACALTHFHQQAVDRVVVREGRVVLFCLELQLFEDFLHKVGQQGLLGVVDHLQTLDGGLQVPSDYVHLNHFGRGFVLYRQTG